MRYPTLEKVEACRVAGLRDQPVGAFIIPFGSSKLRVIASDGEGWDHVSVSLATRVPTYYEMKHVKSLFFHDEEVVMELHVSKNEHVNCHPNCLHLWRPQTKEEIVRINEELADCGRVLSPPEVPGTIPMPPAYLVGPMTSTEGNHEARVSSSS